VADKDAKEKEKRAPFFRYAFHNVYNYTALLGVGTAALLTQNWWLALTGLALEGLWMTFAPDSRVLRKVAWEKRWNAEQQKRKEELRRKQLASLGPGEWRRCQRLEQKRLEIERLVGDNQALTRDLLRDELAKLERLTDAFFDLAVTSNRFEAYLATQDFDDLERQVRRFRTQIEQARTPDDKELAQKNLEVLLRRQERLQEVQAYIRKARGQLELMENTFKLLGDQIVTMRSPAELGGQLDELIDGVEAVRSTAREAEGLMQSVEH
jgi:hypothetical protein